MKKIRKVALMASGLLAMASPALAAYTVPTIDMTNFETAAGYILAAAVAFLIFRKVRKIFGF